MKAMVATWVDILARFKQSGYQPKRTIKLALTCGEETSYVGPVGIITKSEQLSFMRQHPSSRQSSRHFEDSRSLLRHMVGMPECNGRLGVAGICLGEHLAFRAAMNPEVRAAVCFYATDIHSGTLGAGKKDDSLARASEIKGELLHIWGRQDPHVPLEGRRRILARLDEVGTNYQWIEVNGAHAFMRDEGYRYDPELEHQLKDMMLSVFHRKLALGL